SRLPALFRFLGNRRTYHSAALFHHLERRNAEAARAVLLSKFGRFLSYAIYGASALYDGRSRAFDIVDEYGRIQALVAFAVGAPRAGGGNQNRRFLFQLSQFRIARPPRGRQRRSRPQRHLLSLRRLVRFGATARRRR